MPASRWAIVLAVGLGMVATTAWARPYEPVMDPANFVAGIDHLYLPYAPGTTFLYEAETDEGLEVNEVYVTDQTKEIVGVTCMVIRDLVWVEGELREETYDWFAQDVVGDIWYFGEDSTEYNEDGSTSKEGSWEAGVDGALAGVLMPGDPQPGLTYQQEYYEDVAEDTAKVLRPNATASVAYGDFEDCLVTKEWTPLAPGEVEHKVYAPGVGLVLVRELKGPTVRVELIDVTAGPAMPGAALPEPAILSLMAIGGLALIRRRR